MNNVIEIVKRNRKVIIKRSLFFASALVGLTVIGGLFAKKGNEDDCEEFDCDDCDESIDDSLEE